MRIMAIDGSDHLPAIGFETLGGVVGKPRRHSTINGDAVVVIERDQFVELPSSSQGARFVAHTLHQASIAHEHIGVVVNDVVGVAIELLGQEFFGQRHAHRIGQALTQGACGGLYSRGQVHLWVSRCQAVQFAKLLDLRHWQIVTRQVQQGVEQHGGVAVGEHETVAVDPLRIKGVVLHVVCPQGHGHVRHAHGGSGVT